MSNSFNRKIIRTTIILDEKSQGFSIGGSKKLITQGLKTYCYISYGNGQDMPVAQLRIWGLPKDDMNKLTSIKWNVEGVQNNIVRIEAGDDPSDMDVVYQGNISYAYPDYSGSPDVCLTVESHMMRYHLLNPSVVTSYKGEVDVSNLLEELAGKMGVALENNGVNKKLNNIYLTNTAYDQFRTLVSQADIDLYHEPQKFIICPKGEPRQRRVAVISPATGMIGYPVPDNIGASISCLYNRELKAGLKVIVKDSIIEQCNGTWRVTGLDINLESETPDGQWEMWVKVAEIGAAGNAAILNK